MMVPGFVKNIQGKTLTPVQYTPIFIAVKIQMKNYHMFLIFAIDS